MQHLTINDFEIDNRDEDTTLLGLKIDDPRVVVELVIEVTRENLLALLENMDDNR